MYRNVKPDIVQYPLYHQILVNTDNKHVLTPLMLKLELLLYLCDLCLAAQREAGSDPNSSICIMNATLSSSLSGK